MIAALFALALPVLAGRLVPPLPARPEPYDVRRAASGAFEARGPARDVRTTFAPSGVEVAGDGWELGLALEAWGRDGALAAAPEAELRAEGSRVEYRRGALVEWYRNDPLGLEQGFTIEAAPAGPGALHLVLALRGDFAVNVSADGRLVTLVDSSSGAVLRYSGLCAWDADGRTLPVSLEATPGALTIRVDDEGARYPLTVDPWLVSEGQLVGSDTLAGDGFGVSVSVEGHTTAVGASHDVHQPGVGGDVDLGEGSAYVFTRTGASWSEQAKVVASDALTGDHFGASVSLSQGRMIVGATSDETAGTGHDVNAAYVFVRQGTIWTEEDILVGQDTQEGDLFGYDVALDGDTAIVGAPNDTPLGGFLWEGSSYVFTRSGSSWIEQQQLVSDPLIFVTSFGFSVDLSGDTALVGSAGFEAYVFERNGGSWTQAAILPTSGTYDVAIDGDTCVIGEAYSNRAEVYGRSGSSWVALDVLTAAGGGAGEFGWSVAIDHPLIAVGAPGARSAHLYRRQDGGTPGNPLDDTWTEIAVVSDPAGLFGYDVGVDQDTLVVGARGGDAAFVYTVPAPPTAYCTAGTSSAGCNALVSAAGTASATASSGFSLDTAGVEGAKDGLYFFGTGGRQANSWGNGTSFQCVVPPVKRGGLLSGSGTSGACDGVFTQDLNALWCPSCPKPSKNPGAGAIVQAQLWYRDPMNTSNQTTSLSDAIEFCVGP